ncbi:heme peroxidase family protein [Pannus brasiliensis CCIBt3594]|uniref:Heme peroxidase family protein n=1 Tax=Pannus brasiliensis CCIBt3594 TaxID=1427578 RepID=A0AAW9QUM7_9CHRO
MNDFHGFNPRDGGFQPLGQYSLSGKYGRLFPQLPPLFNPGAVSESGQLSFALQELACKMLEEHDKDNRKIPAGYTYLGQFIDHDITFDTSSLSEIKLDPLAILNYRTPKFDLDSVYGIGPKVQPYLYERSTPQSEKIFFKLGATAKTSFLSDLDSFPNDLPRSDDGVALVGDPRNDENLIVAQLHIAFLKFHNKVMEQVSSLDRFQKNLFGAKNDFEIARKIVIWHYQWIVLYDYLPRIAKLDRESVQKLVQENNSEIYQQTDKPFVPLEFSMAAFRFGHSMIRSAYDFNRIFSPPQGSPASLPQLLAFTGSRSASNVPVPSNWIIDWRRFFEIDTYTIEPNFSRQINPSLTNFFKLLAKDNPARNLAFLDLQRGVMAGLPSGQSVANYLGIQPLSEYEIAKSGRDGEIAEKYGFHRESPLLYYILKEAQVRENGERLGDVGSYIVSRVFVGLLKRDFSSFVFQDKNWKPFLPSREIGHFTMADLLIFVNDINPLGD